MAENEHGKKTKKRVKRTQGKAVAESAGAKERKKRPGGQSPATLLGRILPVVSLVIAFVAVVVLMHRLLPPTANEGAATAPSAQDPQVLASSSNTDDYAGVEDQWVTSNSFTTGNKELDAQVKAFCDAHTMEGLSAQDNAQSAFNTIVWSDYEDRAEGEKPSGAEWDLAAARHYFDGGTPEEGKGGKGDVYEFAAAISFCLQYFGFSDAMAVPVIRTTGQTSSALVIVSDEYGQECVCDPTLAADGWMLDRGIYNIVVENIEQDLTEVEALGLTVQTTGENGAQAVEDAGAATDESYGYDGYADDATGYDDSGYEEGYY